MDKRLKPIENMLASLPKPLASQFKSFASSILSRKIEIIHFEKRTHFYESTPTFFPSSTRFQFELSCKEEFKDNNEFIALKEKAKNIVEETKKALRETIISVQKIEEEGSKTLLRQEFIKGLLDIFELCSLYTRTAVKEVSPPFDDKDSSELLLHRFFSLHCANNAQFFNYLHIDKKDMLITIKTRQQKIKWLQDDHNNTTEEMDVKIDSFYTLAETQCFPIIEQITIDLLKHYLKQLNEEEAVQKIEALQKNKAARSITAEVASILTTEPSLNPIQMREFIDDRIQLASTKLSKNSSKTSSSSSSVTIKDKRQKDNKQKQKQPNNNHSKNYKGTRKNQTDNAVKKVGSKKEQTTTQSNNSATFQSQNYYPNTHNLQPNYNHYYHPMGRGFGRGFGRGRGRMKRGDRGVWNGGGRGIGRGRL